MGYRKKYGEVTVEDRLCKHGFRSIEMMPEIDSWALLMELDTKVGMIYLD